MSEHLFGAAHRAHSLLDRHLTASLAMPTVELDAYSAEELVEAIRDLGELAEDANLIANRPPFMLADTADMIAKRRGNRIAMQGGRS